jgi:hypothetical protein
VLGEYLFYCIIPKKKEEEEEEEEGEREGEEGEGEEEEKSVYVQKRPNFFSNNFNPSLVESTG